MQRDPKLTALVAKWDKSQTVAEFVKEELMLVDPRTNKPLRSSVVRNLVYLSENSWEDKDKIKATEVLLNLASANDDRQEVIPPGGMQINFYQNANEKINDGIDRLLDVTPKNFKKEGINSII